MSNTLYSIANSCIFISYIRYLPVNPKTSHLCLTLGTHALYILLEHSINPVISV